jgi:hypothetical protein
MPGVPSRKTFFKGAKFCAVGDVGCGEWVGLVHGKVWMRKIMVVMMVVAEK